MNNSVIFFLLFLLLCLSFVTAQCGLQFSSRGVRPGITTVLARHLDKNTMGYLQWRWGIQSSMNTSIVRDTKSSHFTFAMQVSSQQSYLTLMLAKTLLNQQLLVTVVPKWSFTFCLCSLAFLTLLWWWATSTSSRMKTRRRLRAQ